MLTGLIGTACRWLHGWNQQLLCDHLPPPELTPPAAPRPYQPLERVVLTDDVARSLFEDFADHLDGPRGDEEIGWVLLGLREERETVVVATLPAGADREAGIAHVRFNAVAQGIAGRIVRQRDRRLSMVGVVHTHPGSLRHPSEGDFQGDSLWVGRLRGKEGVFGIGTDDGPAVNGHASAAHALTHEGRCFSWYALGDGDKRYRRLPVHVVPGPDLARPLHPLWDVIEAHADTLDELCRQLAPISFEVVEDGGSRALALSIALAQPNSFLRLLFRRRDVRFTIDRDGEPVAVEPPDEQIERAVFLILAELARSKNRPGLTYAAGSARR